MAWAEKSPAPDTTTVEGLGIATNILWVVIGAVLVIFMQAGFALVETGFCRAKHAAHVVSTNFAIFGLGFVAYMTVGFSFMFGGYSFMYWSNVVRPGDQIDRNLNPNLIPTSATFGGPATPRQPTAPFRTSVSPSPSAWW